jgi:anti-anti-sigma factor
VPQAIEVVVHGKMSSTTVASFKGAIDAAVVARRAILVLGLRDVSFLPSITLSYLADLFVRLDRRGGGICLVEADPKVKIVLSSLGLEQFFQFSDTFEAARAYALNRAAQALRQPRLLVLKGLHEGEEYPVTGTPLVIGTDPDAAIRIQAPRIEARHAEVYRNGDQCFVRDLGSKAGTFIGKRKIANDPLAPGDIIRVFEFEVRYLGPDEPAPDA